MKNLLAACLFVSLSACSAGGGDPMGTEITPALLEDGAQVQAVANRLEPADRDAFTRYVAGRSMRTAMGAPSLVNSEGKDPATVQEAIALQKWSDGIDERERLAQAPHSAVIQSGIDSVSIAEYNAHVQAYNEAQAAAKSEREAGPPAGLGK